MCLLIPRFVGVLLIWTVAQPAIAQGPSEPGQKQGEELVLHAYTLEHQPAGEAIHLIHPLLSEHGAVEIQPGGNTLVIRDTVEVVERLIRLLKDFDHPARPVRLTLQLVRAGLKEDRVDGESELPKALVSRLRELLRYEDYHLLATAALEIREGENVSYELGDDFKVEFRMGTLLADRRVKLRGFRVARQSGNPDAKQLIHTNLSLWLDKPMILGLARAETSDRALMVVLTSSLARDSVP